MQGKTKDLFMTRTEGVESRSLGVGNADILSLSSSGMLVLLPGDTLAQVPLTGGTPRELSTDVTGASWFPDGTKMVVARRVGGKSTLEFPPGKTIYNSPHNIELVRVSPNGDLIAFDERPFGGSNGSVVVVDLNGKKLSATKEIFPFGIAWQPEGEEVWYSSWNLETGRGSMLGALSPKGKDRLIQNFPFSAYLLDISSNGSVLISFDEDRTISRAKIRTEQRLNRKFPGWTVQTFETFLPTERPCCSTKTLKQGIPLQVQCTSEKLTVLPPFVWQPAFLSHFLRMGNG